MGLVPDKGAVQDLAAASADPAFGDRVHAGRPDVAKHGPDPGIGEDGVERGREVRSAVADHEPGSVCLLVRVHEEVACLLGGPFAGWVQGDAQDADAPGRVLEHGEDVGLGAVDQVGREEVARQDRVGLRTQELRPGRPGPPWRQIDPGGLQDLPRRRRGYLHSHAGQLAVNPAVPPAGVLAGQPDDQGPDVPAGGRAAARAAHGPGGPASADDVAVPVHDRVRGDQQPQPLTTGSRYHADQGHKQSPVRPGQLRAARPVRGRRSRRAAPGPARTHRPRRWSRRRAAFRAGPARWPPGRGRGRGGPRWPRPGPAAPGWPAGPARRRRAAWVTKSWSREPMCTRPSVSRRPANHFCPKLSGR
jgi:hypothetical protein